MCFWQSCLRGPHWEACQPRCRHQSLQVGRQVIVPERKWPHPHQQNWQASAPLHQRDKRTRLLQRCHDHQRKGRCVVHQAGGRDGLVSWPDGLQYLPTVPGPQVAWSGLPGVRVRPQPQRGSVVWWGPLPMPEVCSSIAHMCRAVLLAEIDRPQKQLPDHHVSLVNASPPGQRCEWPEPDYVPVRTH